MDEHRRQALNELADEEAAVELERLTAEQAALLRLATVIAEGAPPAAIFAAAGDEIDRLIGSRTVISRYSDDGTSIVSVGVSARTDVPVGRRWELEAGMASAEVYRTGRSARIEEVDWSSRDGPAAETARRIGIHSATATPVLVGDRLWGTITVLSAERLPAETEERLERFSRLVATAIANADSREAVARAQDSLAQVAEEQAALRRVATLVAQDAAPPEIFAAVSVEVDRLFCLGAHTQDVAGVVRFDPGPEHLVVGVSRTLQAVKLGSRWDPVDLFAPTRVLHTRRSARVDEGDLASIGGPVADFLRAEGYLSQAASPIVVGGRLWGAISVNSGETLAPDTEERLEKFTELVAAAIANAESHEALAALADEQAALRRVATLVARDAPSTEVFDAVATEVGTLFATEITVVGRYDDDGMATSIGNWSASGGGVPLGTRSALGGQNVLSLVAETGKPARIDGYDDASGEAADIARRYGWRSSIAAPIIVEDRVWGVMLVATQRPEPFPAGAEQRLAAFTDLVATAVANTKSRAEVEQLADEQAALRRVATLVAKEDLPEEVFAKVVEETARLLGGVECTLLRSDHDGAATNVGSWGELISAAFPVGARFFPDGDGAAATVLRTGHPHRIDDYSAVADPIARSARERGIETSVACPIVVRGAIWGAIVVGATGAEPFPPETELRLTQFADLVGTAVANADARGEIVRLAEEQAAQRRVATLVARGAQPREIFSAVTDEVGRLFDTELAIVGRFEEDPPAVVAVAVGKAVKGIDVGSSWRLAAPETSNDTFRSRRAVRATDRLRQRSAALADMMDRLGVISMVASPIVVDGRLWGSMIVPSLQELAADTEERLEKFTDLVGIAIANADGKSELAASRRRIVTASDAERRRIERNLHDGTQQRLVSLGLAVRAAEANLPPDRPDLRDELSRVAMGLSDAVEDLQEISRGIHPAILSRGGLAAALRTLATRSPIAVDLDVKTEARLAEPVEVAAYFVVSEALANAAKHSQATRIDVSLHQRGGRLRVSIGDDGVGGADPGRGSGLVGLTDRVAALGGSLTVHSRPGEGTQIRAELPVET